MIIIKLTSILISITLLSSCGTWGGGGGRYKTPKIVTKDLPISKVEHSERNLSNWSQEFPKRNNLLRPIEGYLKERKA